MSETVAALSEEARTDEALIAAVIARKLVPQIVKLAEDDVLINACGEREIGGGSDCEDGDPPQQAFVDWLRGLRAAMARADEFGVRTLLNTASNEWGLGE